MYLIILKLKINRLETFSLGSVASEIQKESAFKPFVFCSGWFGSLL